VLKYFPSVNNNLRSGKQTEDRGIREYISRASLWKIFGKCIQRYIFSDECVSQREHHMGDRSYKKKKRSSQDVVLITVLTQKVTCVLLFNTYEYKIELSLRHYYKAHTPHGGLLRSPVCASYGASSQAFRKWILKLNTSENIWVL